jgi:hypothetical protein
MREKVLRHAPTVVTSSIAIINLDAENHFVWQPFPTSDHFIQPETTFTNNVGYFGNDLAAGTASKKSDLQQRETPQKMSLTNLVLEEEWEGLLLQELRKSFYPHLDESRTIPERIMRKLHSPKIVSNFA